MNTAIRISYSTISTNNKSPRLRVTYNGYDECAFGPQASGRFLLWSFQPPYEKLTLMSPSSNCPTEIRGLESSNTCWTLCGTNVEADTNSAQPQPRLRIKSHRKQVIQMHKTMERRVNTGCSRGNPKWEKPRESSNSNYHYVETMYNE